MRGISKILWAALWFQMVIPSPGWSVEVGEPLPDFGVQTFAGETLSRASLAGKPALIIFWNTWCPTCVRELPQVSRIAGQFPPKELTVLAINTGFNDSEGKARTYWKKRGYLFPVGFDHSFEIGQHFGVIGVPTVFLVDAKGIVRYKNSSLPGSMEERVRELSRK
jgi:peroxiredoxin